jgi:3-deoxy-manno-octulosonate cytidylyltransferase (CMP-KDO synthetase)
MSRLIAVIPARYAATRFPGKPLVAIAGQPMVQQVWNRCLEARTFDEVVIATDDLRIAEAVRAFHGTVELTSGAHLSGTDRVAELAQLRPGGDDDVFVNVQGDEPAIHPEALWTLGQAFQQDPQLQMATLVRPLDEREHAQPNTVKAVRDEAGFALYFSRANLAGAWAHLGIYGYRRPTLQRLARLQPTSLEKAERLEQLRALGNGIRILCCETKHRGQAVDSPEDVARAEAALLQLPKR